MAKLNTGTGTATAEAPKDEAENYFDAEPERT